jgi:hypothetical protein
MEFILALRALLMPSMKLTKAVLKVRAMGFLPQQVVSSGQATMKDRSRRLSISLPTKCSCPLSMPTPPSLTCH